MEANMAQKFQTKVDRLGFSAGTPVTWSGKPDDVGKTGKKLVSMPGGGGLFYSDDELMAA